MLSAPSRVAVSALTSVAAASAAIQVSLSRSAPALPASAEAAVAAAKGSDWLKGVMGDLMHELVIQQAEREIGFIAAQVTPVEFDRYLRNL